MDVGASGAGTASKSSNFWGILAVGSALKVLEHHVHNLEWAGIVIAESEVRLAVTLVHLNGVINLFAMSSVVSPINLFIGACETYACYSKILEHDVVHDSVTTASIEVAAFRRRNIRPPFLIVSGYNLLVVALNSRGYLTL